MSCLQAVDKPDSAERWLLASQLSQLRDWLRPGLTHLNWHALGIQAFVTPVCKVEHTLSVCQDGSRIHNGVEPRSGTRPASLQPKWFNMG